MNIVDYEDWMGEIAFPEGFDEKLTGRSFEEQMACYRITESRTLARTSYGELERERVDKASYALEEYDDFRGLVVKDGLVVGVLLHAWSSEKNEGVPCLPYKRVCTYYASDNDGAGYNDRTDYAYLICV